MIKAYKPKPMKSMDVETPGQIKLAPVQQAQDEGVKFRGIKRTLASGRNGFKKMKL